MSEQPTTKPTPTRGQQRILQLCCRVAYTLCATRAVNGNQAHPLVLYRIWETATGRLIQEVTPQMLESLLLAGWLQRTPSARESDLALTWAYRVTEAGITAANGPTSAHDV